VKSQKLVVFTICLLLGAFAGCKDKNKPVNSVIQLSDKLPTKPGVPGVGIYAEEGGTLQFRSESKSYPYFKITIDDNGVCSEGSTLYGVAGDPNVVGSIGTPATCHVTKTSQFTFMTDEASTPEELKLLPSKRHNGPFTAYTKPCPPVCK
jgi:hypothetical protein